MKYSKTALMYLSHEYGHILKKCALLNAALLMGTMIALPANAQEAAQPQSRNHNALFYSSDSEDPTVVQDPSSTDKVSYRETDEGLEIQADGWTSTAYGAYVNADGELGYASVPVKATIINSTFKNNTATAEGTGGGAMSLWHDGLNGAPNAQIQVKNSTFENNTASWGGAVVLMPLNGWDQEGEYS